jgi:predicted small secreted protein
MKKLILTIGLAVTAGVIYAQSALQVQTATTTTRVVAKAEITSEAAGALMQTAVMETGSIAVRQVGTNRVVVVTGVATITLPEAAVTQLAALPDGYSVGDIQRGSFGRATNGGYNVTVTFVK